jgi:hypothetical protein
MVPTNRGIAMKTELHMEVDPGSLNENQCREDRHGARGSDCVFITMIAEGVN